MDLVLKHGYIREKKTRISLWQHLRFVMVLKKSPGKLLPPMMFRAADIYTLNTYTDFSSYMQNILLLLIISQNISNSSTQEGNEIETGSSSNAINQYLCPVIYLITAPPLPPENRREVMSPDDIQPF